MAGRAGSAWEMQIAWQGSGGGSEGRQRKRPAVAHQKAGKRGGNKHKCESLVGSLNFLFCRDPGCHHISFCVSNTAWQADLQLMQFLLSANLSARENTPVESGLLCS